jgi:hypothetical protein
MTGRRTRNVRTIEHNLSFVGLLGQDGGGVLGPDGVASGVT